ncbi:hypothetical protein BCAR13_520086 [Paraburkholderia caribensis]|nr:hypothetical protein BCAR13_520086 [Paraburkholderia caribensis]
MYEPIKGELHTLVASVQKALDQNITADNGPNLSAKT